MSKDQDRAAEAVEFIRAYTDEHGFPPTRRQLGEHFGLRSPAGGQYLLEELVRQGLVEVNPKQPRAIKVVVGKAATEEA